MLPLPEECIHDFVLRLRTGRLHCAACLQMAASGMIDLDDFMSINKQMAEYDEKREKVIKDSRGAPHVPVRISAHL